MGLQSSEWLRRIFLNGLKHFIYQVCYRSNCSSVCFWPWHMLFVLYQKIKHIVLYVYGKSCSVIIYTEYSLSCVNGTAPFYPFCAFFRWIVDGWHSFNTKHDVNSVNVPVSSPTVLQPHKHQPSSITLHILTNHFLVKVSCSFGFISTWLHCLKSAVILLMEAPTSLESWLP